MLPDTSIRAEIGSLHHLLCIFVKLVDSKDGVYAWRRVQPQRGPCKSMPMSQRSGQKLSPTSAGELPMPLVVSNASRLMLLDLLAALDEVHGLQTCLTHPVPFGTINN